MKKTRSFLLASLFATLLTTTCFLAPHAQTKPAGTKKSKTETCDGALDIVPAKAMTFTRKRRPGKPDNAPVTQPGAKTSNELK